MVIYTRSASAVVRCRDLLVPSAERRLEELIMHCLKATSDLTLMVAKDKSDGIPFTTEDGDLFTV